ncbi:MAG TPA: hypothetical protein IAC82_10030 [Candidatus Merdivicinus intestinigallinarum]|nr:hypothetical protein [Candidatus Merdivicinus intestinigallinarum]
MSFIVTKHQNTPYLARTLRFPADLYQQLKDTAAEHHTSVSSLVVQCCEFALQNMEEPSHSKSSS